MPWFKNKDGEVFEVSESHAEDVIRKQGRYEEVEAPVEKVPSVKKKVGRPRKQST